MDMSSMSSMSSMTMASLMDPMSTTMAAASSTASPMSMGGMGGGMDMGGDCKISMLWNWNTIDACFLSSSWHITSSGMFAGSCIGVIALVMALEFVRRVQREYDRSLQAKTSSHGTQHHVAGHASHNAAKSADRSDSNSSDHTAHDLGASKMMNTTTASNSSSLSHGETPPPNNRQSQWATILHQAIRASIYTVQFAAAYFVMLLAMYYNGYIIISILIGAFLGHFFFGWDLARRDDRGEKGTLVPCCA